MSSLNLLLLTSLLHLVILEVNVGKSIIGKNRRVDVFVHSPDTQKAMSIECKYQQSSGTVDEKIPYALNDIDAMWMPACIVYAGEGFSEGVFHLLQSSEVAAYCLPEHSPIKQTASTRELDHIIASVFGWWDIVLDKKPAFDLSTWTAPIES